MSAKNVNILLVEDDEDIRISVGSLLRLEGYQVIESINGADALERLEAAEFKTDLIVLDLMMPKMDGFEFLRRLRKLEAPIDCPIIIMSADVQAVERLEGSFQILTKPIDIFELLGKIASHVGSASADSKSLSNEMEDDVKKSL